MISQEEQKRVAAKHAAGLVEPGMAVGLGSGTTMAFVLEELGNRLRQGLGFTGIATSEETEALAKSLDIRLTSLDRQPVLDLALDGADEVDPKLNLIKGRGGALLREKIVAMAAQRFVVVIDESKLVEKLGGQTPVPVEVIPFGWRTTQSRLEKLGVNCELRGGVSPYTSDNGNFIIDCTGSNGLDFTATADSIKIQIGVIEHGIFLGAAYSVVVGRATGEVEVLHR